MTKFNKAIQSVLNEASLESELGVIFREITNLLVQKGLKPYESNDVIEVVQKAVKFAFNEGYKAAEKKSFK